MSQPVPRRGERGRRRVAVHLMHLASDLLGDDWLGRRIRVALLRAFGARIGPDSWFHGGTYFTEPRNLRVGAQCFVNRNCYLDLESVVSLGDHVVIGHGTSLVTTMHPLGPSRRRAGREYTGLPVSIADGAWLGANVTVMPGVSVGPGAVVGAGSVLTKNVAADLMVGGVPARTIRHLSQNSLDYDVLEPGDDHDPQTVGLAE